MRSSHIGIKRSPDAKDLQSAVKAGDVKARSGLDQVTQGLGSGRADHRRFFAKLDEAIDAWPDAKRAITRSRRRFLRKARRDQAGRSTDWSPT